MEKNLKMFLPLTLKETLLRKVAGRFCSSSVVLKLCYKSLYSRLPTSEIKKWLEATEKKILKLGLPQSLKKQLIDRIPDICFEIRKWKRERGSFWFGSLPKIEFPDVSKLFSTSTGAIDYRKLAEQYVLCDRKRHEIACDYCEENNIPLLWLKISEGEKGQILESELSKLVALRREFDRDLPSFNRWIFEKLAKDGVRVMVEYFFRKLSPEEREVSLMRTAYDVTDGDVLFYLLSLMTPEQQMEMVMNQPIQVLCCFFEWPRRHLLQENAGLIWTFLNQSDYGNLLERISATLQSGEDYFPKLLQEFFLNAPPDFIEKSFVGQESDLSSPACRLLCTFIGCEDSESIEVLFRHADAGSRVKLVSYDGVLNRFFHCILEEKWHEVETCLREASLSGEERGSLKESFRRFLDQRVGGPCVERKFRRFFELLDKDDASEDKERKAETLKLE